MRPSDTLHEAFEQENDTFFTQFAQTYADYHGCLPQDDDAADHYRQSIRAIKVS